MSPTLLSVIGEHPIATVIVIAIVMWAIQDMVSAYFNRNKPVCSCECCTDCDDESE